ncbi:MAG: hypothetical protein KIT09_19245 [Bryobacteraceae bacterium]|nr:hypothetical protein [Bryobacteraceae bacterium]
MKLNLMLVAATLNATLGANILAAHDCSLYSMFAQQWVQCYIPMSTFNQEGQWDVSLYKSGQGQIATQYAHATGVGMCGMDPYCDLPLICRCDPEFYEHFNHNELTWQGGVRNKIMAISGFCITSSTATSVPSSLRFVCPV